MTERTLEEQFADDPWPVVGFLTTEHNTLTSSRAATIAETTGRVTAYLTTLSAAFVAVALVRDVAGSDRAFAAAGAVVLGIVVMVGVVSFARCLQASVEDLLLARRIEQLRRTYLRLAPGLHGALFPPPEQTADPRFSAGFAAPGKWQLTLTLAGLVGLVNSVAAGALVGLLTALAGMVPAAAVGAGTVTCLVLIVAHMWIQDRIFTRRLRRLRR